MYIFEGTERNLKYMKFIKKYMKFDVLRFFIWLFFFYLSSIYLIVDQFQIQNIAFRMSANRF